MNKKFWADWTFPLMSLISFATLLAAMLSQMSAINVGSLISFSSGLLAYTMMLAITFMGSRPRFLEKFFGMPQIFEVHGVMSMVMSFLILFHVIIQWNGFQSISEMSIVSQTGWIAVIALILIVYTGVFSLSEIFVQYIPTLNAYKNKHNREASLWVHRLAVISIIFVYIHLIKLPFLANNTVFMVLLTAYTGFVLIYWVVWKLKVLMLPKYEVIKLYRGTPAIWVLEVAPKKGQIPQFNGGEYFWIYFRDGANISKEGHPFSTSSASTDRYSNSIEFMIKDAGDWTESLKNINIGDTLVLEGPHGDMLPPSIQEEPEDVPFVLLAGGIGLTPMLSILRQETQRGSQRPMHLVWGLAIEEDLFMLDELKEMQEKNPNLDVQIIFSGEEVEGYAFGFIDNDYLERIGAAHYHNGHFFVCGPGPMIDATKRMLDHGNVSYDQRHIDDFRF